MIEVTNENFNEIKNDGTSIVYVSASWCGPCKVYAPIMEKLATELSATGIKISKINVDDNRELAVELGVSGVPTTIFFKDGEEKERKVGMMQEKQVKEILEKYS